MMTKVEVNRNLRIGQLLRSELYRELMRLAVEHEGATDFHHRARLAKEHAAILGMLREPAEVLQ